MESSEIVDRFVSSMSMLDTVQRLAMVAMAFQVRQLNPGERTCRMGDGLFLIDDACVGRSNDDSEYIKTPAFVYEVGSLPWSGDILSQSLIDSYLSTVIRVTRSFLIPVYEALFGTPCITQDEVRFLISKGVSIVNTHREQFARGIYYGAMGDFVTAAYLLAPQIENFVRVLYNVNDISIIGCRNQLKGFGALLNDPSGANVMSPVPAFEFRCVFADKRGFNLRNLLAHGNLSDMDTDIVKMFYVWWLGLRMVVNLKMARRDIHRAA